MTQYQMPVKAIKSIIKKELDSFKDAFYRGNQEFMMADVMKEMIYRAHSDFCKKLEECNSYDDLEEFISYAGYRMSLDEWISSL